MKHKIAQLENLVKQMGDRSANTLTSRRKPQVSIHIEKHADEMPEDRLLQKEEDKSLDPANEEHELSDSGHEERKSMFKRFGK